MGAMSPFHWIILLAVAAILIVPYAQILRRVGMSPWLALLYLVPLVNLVFLWVFAFMRWPRDEAEKAEKFV